MRKILLFVLCVFPALLYAQLQAPPFNPKKVVPYVATGPETVAAMLKLAGVTKTDLVIDLGCGDGRIVIAAAKLWRELKPGTRVVSHTFDMEDWTPDKVEEVGGSQIFLWVIKAR